MTTNQRVRMTISQFTALESAGEDGRLTWTDQRVVKALVRRGWARAHTPTRRGRRKRSQWYITPAGRAAMEGEPEIIPARPRPHWRAHWTHKRVASARYLVDGHEVVRPARGMLWRVNCPRVSKPIGYGELLAEAVELLAEHLWGCTRSMSEDFALE